MTFSTITRHDNTLWGHLINSSAADALTEIQIQTPVFKTPGLAFTVADTVSRYLTEKRIRTLSQLKSEHFIPITSCSKEIVGIWKITLQQNSSFWNKLWQSIPFTTMYPNKTIATIQATRFELFPLTMQPKGTISEKILKKPLQLTESFTDAFTILASENLQTNEPNFVSEQTIISSFRFEINGPKLELHPISNAIPTDFERDQNRKATKAFSDLIIAEFGKEKLDYVNAAYGCSLEELYRSGLPLTPDHIFKTNIGMNNVELGDIQRLLDRLIARQVTQLPHKHRRMLDKLPSNFLSTLPTSSVSVKTLPPDLFNTLVSIVMPTDEERVSSFTGRKIRDRAIKGCNTMGDPNIFNPSRDLFELLHVFPQMKWQECWEVYYQVLAHVVSKKSLFRKTTAEDIHEGHRAWHVGILLPAPSSDSGPRWYYNAAFYDDGQGNINYLLLPACDGYQDNGKPLPCIKNYRSTASNQNAVDWLESIAADLNPYGSPGSIDPQRFFDFEKRDFFKRTIPLWVAHLLHADKKKTLSLYQEALTEYYACINKPGFTPPDILSRAKELLAHGTQEEIKAFLYAEAILHKEFPEHKTAQDIVCIGHSLGGTLAQFSAYYYLPRGRRITLPDHKLVCFASRGTGINTYQDSLFMKFGRRYAALLSALNQVWEINHDFERGDDVAAAGGSHLGTTGYDEAADSIWLRFMATVFKPLVTATRNEITTLPTHERRQKVCSLNVDYTESKLSPSELCHFDHDWILTSNLIALFGFRVLISTKITEGVRRVAAILTRPLMIIAEKINNLLWPPIGKRNLYGDFILHYRP